MDKCNYYGCNNIGTLSRSLQGGDVWWCRYHFFNRDSKSLEHKIKTEKEYNKMLKNYGKKLIER